MKPPEERISGIIKILKAVYPHSRTALAHHSPFELLVSTILAAQCTDKRVNMITPALFKKYKGPEGFARAKKVLLEKDIRSTGFFRSKAKNIIAASKMIVKDFSGSVPSSMEQLILLPGVARKTANIVLSSSFGKAVGIAVDTHVRRLSGRMGLSGQKDPNKIEKDLMKIVPREHWIDFNYIMVDHGRKTCGARKPLCGECPVARLCPKIGL